MQYHRAGVQFASHHCLCLPSSRVSTATHTARPELDLSFMIAFDKSHAHHSWNNKHPNSNRLACDTNASSSRGLLIACRDIDRCRVTRCQPEPNLNYRCTLIRVCDIRWSIWALMEANIEIVDNNHTNANELFIAAHHHALSDV